MKTMKFKRAMLMLTLLVMTLSAVTGGTIAWFTDSVNSANNVIKAGNLDIELYHDNGVKVTADTELFTLPTLWEPGAVAWENLTVKNEGDLALKYEMVMNATGENTVNGYGLSSALKVGIVEDGVENGAERDAVIGQVSEWTTFSEFVATGKLLPEGSDLEVDGATEGSETYGVVIYWQPGENDNNWNVNNGKEVSDYTDDANNYLRITLGVKLEATQLTAEEDSFDNQYDASAPASLWNGKVPAGMPASLVVDGDTQTVHVKDAEAFAYLSTLSETWAKLYTDGNGRAYSNYANGKGANYYYSSRWTVSLEDDIDLANHPIDPVKIVLGESTGASAFNGNGHVIRNINTTTGGLFANDNRISYANLVLENVKATNGALTGSSNTSIQNVTVKNAAISGVDYVGGLVGYIYGDVTGCEVIDSTVLATGKEAGGLIGYAATSSSGTIANNTVRNTSVYANNRAAGLVAQPNVNIKVYNNTVDTVTVGAEDRSQHKPGAIVSNNLASVKDNENTVKNVVVLDEDVTIATDNTELQAAIDGGDSTIVLGAGEFTADLYVVPANRKLTITGQGAATKLNFKNQQVRLELFDELTISNCTMGRMVNKSWGQLVFGSSTVAGGVYTISNCIFNGESTQGIYINQDVAATFNIENCTFNGDFGGEGAITIQNNDGVNITVNVTDCSFNNIPATSHEIYMLYAYAGWKLNAPGVDAFWKEKQ